MFELFNFDSNFKLIPGITKRIATQQWVYNRIILKEMFTIEEQNYANNEQKFVGEYCKPINARLNEDTNETL